MYWFVTRGFCAFANAQCWTVFLCWGLTMWSTDFLHLLHCLKVQITFPLQMSFRIGSRLALLSLNLCLWNCHFFTFWFSGVMFRSLPSSFSKLQLCLLWFHSVLSMVSFIIKPIWREHLDLIYCLTEVRVFRQYAKIKWNFLKVCLFWLTKWHKYQLLLEWVIHLFLLYDEDIWVWIKRCIWDESASM